MPICLYRRGHTSISWLRTQWTHCGRDLGPGRSAGADFERHDTVGGAAASADVFGDGSIVDLGAAAHPFGVASPIFRHLGLEDYGLEWLHSEYPMAHPFDDAPAAILHRNVRKTARALGADQIAWRLIHRGIVNSIDDYLEQILRPLLRFRSTREYANDDCVRGNGIALEDR